MGKTVNDFYLTIVSIVAGLAVLGVYQPPESYSQGSRSYVNVGLKVGQLSTSSKNLVVGIEVSYSWWRGNLGEVYGVALGADFWSKKRWKMNALFEVSSLAGIAVGPSVVFRDEASELGISLMGYVWLGIIPFYNYIILLSENLQEAGVFLKAPILMSGKEFVPFAAH